MAKYDVDRFETPPDEDLVCCICQCVLDNPLESPCRHVYCKVCIETWLTNRSSCPNCRKRLRISKLKPVLPIVRNMINRLKIICENRDHGCEGGIKLEVYDRHVETCECAPIKCLNTGCRETVLRKHMLAHEQTCKFRLIMCKKGCGLPVSMEVLRKHNCLAELKKSMAAMEEQYKQRLRDLETKLTTKIQVLEDRVKAFEENCQPENWGSARSSMDYANSEDRAMEDIANALDYVTNRIQEEDDDNSFYYSGDDDEAFGSSPENQEEDVDYYSVPRDSNSEQSQQDQDQDDETDGRVEDERHEEEVNEEADAEHYRDSDSAFFLNTDAESNNDSDGDLNDSLLDSSDGEVDPVQVYEVSPTSPSSDHAAAEHDSSPEGDSVEEVVHMPSENSPHSSTHDAHGSSSSQSQSVLQSSRMEDTSRGNQHRVTGGGRISPHANSLGSLTVEYGSSGRSTPHRQESIYLSDDGNDTLNEPRHRSRSTSRWSRDNRGRDREQTRAGENDNRDDSGSSQRRYQKKKRGRDGESSRRSHKSSRNSKSRIESTTEHRDPSIAENSRRTEDSHLTSEHAVPSFHEEREHERRQTTRESRERERRGEYSYWISLDDESDSSTDPSWEKASHEGSTDITISDEYASSYDSLDSDSSPEVYERFLTSLGSAPSSESDRTWTPGDPDDEGWETERDWFEDSNDSDYHPEDDTAEVDSHDINQDDLPSGEDSSQEAADADTSHHASGQASVRSSGSSRSSSHHSPERRDSRDRRGAARTAHGTYSESDSTARSLEGSSYRNKRPLAESSSESETEEDHHPIWKRRRSESSK